MRTARVLTVSPSMLCAGGGLLPGDLLWGVYLVPGGCTWSGGVYLLRGGTWSRGGCLLWGVYLVMGRCTWSWGVYLVPGVSAPVGVPGPRGCTWSRGVYLVPGVSAPGGVCSGGVYLVLGGVCSRGGVRYSPREQNDKQVQKYYLAPNFVCGR